MSPSKRVYKRLLTATLLLTSLLLGGCASVRLIDNQVQSFSKLGTLSSPATYRFERLPSQLDDPKQSVIERMAAQALEKVGLQLADSTNTSTVASPTPYTVQISARSERDDAANPHALLYSDPFFGLASRPRATHPGVGFYGSLFWVAPVFPPPYYRREVSLLLRETQGNTVVYETSARHDGPWHDTEHIFPAMFAAALQDFPNPAPGERLVGIEIPR
jgi:predicted small secreted protein